LFEPNAVDWPAISAAWPDLLPKSCELLGVSLFGDLFVGDESGRVFMLEVTTGELKQIASCPEEFEWDLAQPDKRGAWLLQPLAEAALAAGLSPKTGECLAFQTPPMLGGELHPSNLIRCDLVKYHQGLSQLLPQLRGLAPGTRIVLKAAQRRST